MLPHFVLQTLRRLCLFQVVRKTRGLLQIAAGHLRFVAVGDLLGAMAAVAMATGIDTVMTGDPPIGYTLINMNHYIFIYSPKL